MGKGSTGDSPKAQQWRRWIQLWQTSGLTVRAFCRRHHLAEHNFYVWRRVLQQRNANAAVFVPVQVVDEAASAADGTLEVLVSGGRRVRVAPGFDATTLRRLLTVLEEKPC